MAPRLLRITLALLLLAAPAWSAVAQAWTTGVAPCAQPQAPRVCPCQAAAMAEEQAGCGCGEGASCQLESAPPSAQEESLPSQAWQPDPLPPGTRLAGDGREAAWPLLAQETGGAPWRPPKPLYLRLRSLLI